MATAATIQKQGNKLRISVELTLEAGHSMLDYEEQILQALNEAGTFPDYRHLSQRPPSACPKSANARTSSASSSALSRSA